jgi:serine/threonine protein phosphatase PrpC
VTRGVRSAVPPELSWAAATDIGRRQRNEDAYAGEARFDRSRRSIRGVFIVCDGMGGHVDGNMASALAVSVLRQELSWALDAEWPPPTTVTVRARQAVAAANRAIFEGNERGGTSGRDRAGTTVAMLLVANGQAHVGHVGDSRVYRVTKQEAVLLTIDHNVANREIRRGTPAEFARQRADARHLTQALGPFSEQCLQLELQSHAIVEPTLFVLCTDGVSEGDVVEREAPVLLRPLLARGADLEEGCRSLVAAAWRAAGNDNMTVILVRVDPNA